MKEKDLIFSIALLLVGGILLWAYFTFGIFVMYTASESGAEERYSDYYLFLAKWVPFLFFISLYYLVKSLVRIFKKDYKKSISLSAISIISGMLISLCLVGILLWM
ncbi:MAG: hypothetical protein OEV93_02495 [Candidatus Moranbacteria bacterium]|nr:hypothetical protein [Candidatus Moranbacteria bacterium]